MAGHLSFFRLTIALLTLGTAVRLSAAPQDPTFAVQFATRTPPEAAPYDCKVYAYEEGDISHSLQAGYCNDTLQLPKGRYDMRVLLSTPSGSHERWFNSHHLTAPTTFPVDFTPLPVRVTLQGRLHQTQNHPPRFEHVRILHTSANAQDATRLHQTLEAAQITVSRHAMMPLRRRHGDPRTALVVFAPSAACTLDGLAFKEWEAVWWVLPHEQVHFTGYSHNPVKKTELDELANYITRHSVAYQGLLRLTSQSGTSTGLTFGESTFLPPGKYKLTMTYQGSIFSHPPTQLNNPTFIAFANNTLAIK